MNYKKESKLKEELFFLFHLYNTAKYGWFKEEEARAIDEVFSNKIKDHSTKSKCKWMRKLILMDKKTGFFEFYKTGASARKVLMMLHTILLELKMANYDLDHQVEELAEKMLEIEASEEVDEEIWGRLYESAQKQGKKLLQKMQAEGMFSVRQ